MKTAPAAFMLPVRFSVKNVYFSVAENFSSKSTILCWKRRVFVVI